MRRAVLVAATALLAFTVSRPSVPRPRTLTLEDRVRAQLAIERVYYSHQEGASEPFEKAVPVAGVELKVRNALKQSLALEKYWRTPVTAAMLHAESERMARTTLMPERLRELYAALGNDPFLIEEMLARSILVDRLVRNFYAFDQRFHGEERRQAETVREMVHRYGPETTVDGANRFEMEFSRVNGPNSSPLGQARSLEAVTQKGHRDAIDGVHRLALPPEEFEQVRTRAPARIAEVGPLTEEREAFTIQILLESAADRIRVATYRVPKKPFDFWWREARDNLREYEVEAVASAGQALPEIRGVPAASGQSTPGAVAAPASCVPDNTWLPVPGNTSPGSRTDATVIWTGTRMIVWGGDSGYISNTGSSYDPATDTWTQLSILNAPRERYQHTAVWTGSRMIVWGGADYGNVPSYDGGIYDPLNDQWSPMNSFGAGPGRRQHTAVWTGSVMVVWGGWGIGDQVETEGFARRYDPSSDSWSLIYGTTSQPTPRYLHSAVWTGTEMVVWGGLETSTGNVVKTGGRYNPVTDSWVSTRINPGAPSARMSHSAVWTGSRMLIWGGSTASGATDSGAKYDPIGNTWESLASTGAPVPRYGHSVVWTGGRMIVWGGTDGTSYFSSGGGYDPVGNAWNALSNTNAPPARRDPLTVWTGSQMVLYGGTDAGGSGLVSGGRYDLASDSWTPVSIHDAPEATGGRTVVWTGSLMVVWGGPYAGGRYDPATNTWSDTSTIGATPRIEHTAVWTGTRMIVWGGTDTANYTAGLYDPILDSWSLSTTLNAPLPRTGHVAVWSGSEMIVWGGSGGITGGRYNPATDTWVPTSTVGAPAQIQATAVWTGSRMVIWGGMDPSGLYFANTGARYDPSTDTWLPTSTIGAPSQRTYHTAVWTGSRMVIYGGYDGPHACGNFNCTGLSNGGRYDPIADSWQPVASPSYPIYNHSAVWGGPNAGMIIWGGRRENYGEVGWRYLNFGFRYNPATNTWTQIFASGTPRVRAFHSAVWTGSFMIVWGGETYYPDYVLTDGGLYAFGQGVDDDGDGFSECGGDCNDANPLIHPGAPEICNGLDDDCDGIILENADSDGDGSTICGGDCNDANPLIHPGAVESCNGVDDNCNGLVDESFPDADADGHASCMDCNDQDPAVHPGAIETCDGLDNNCNGTIDEAFVDADADGYASCVDCSDSNAAVHPNAVEICNGIDDNCATGIDEGFPDVDGDGYASCVDCNDSNGSIHPGAPEVCNNLDDDCNSLIDDGLDLDGDGHGPCDCDDQEPGVWSAPSEVQNLHLQAGALTQLDWSDMSSSVGPLTFYDVYSGSLSASPGINFSSATCLNLGQMETNYTDLQVSPSPGSGYWYLLRALNPCGIGTFGAGSDGQERIIPDCP